MAKLAKILFIPVRHHERTADLRTNPQERERRTRWVMVGLLVGALGLFWAGVSLSRSENAAGIGNLPVAARRNLVAYTVNELTTLCRDPAASAGSLRDHCVAQARFVLQLPECADACQRAATNTLPHAHR
jgi:hypothetical protein